MGGGTGLVASDPCLEAGEEADVLQQALGAHSLARLVPTNCIWKGRKLLQARSTYIPRVPQCMSPRWHWDPPPPLPNASVHLTPRTRGGDTLAGG